jgi:hypothetical protein
MNFYLLITFLIDTFHPGEDGFPLETPHSKRSVGGVCTLWHRDHNSVRPVGYLAKTGGIGQSLERTPRASLL